MPYVREGNCVYKKNSDGSKGESMGCSDSEEMARKHMAALYAAEDGNAVTEMDSDEDDMMNKAMSVSFKQDSTGQWWFIGEYSNKFKDRDEEILSDAAHQEYVQWLKETGIRPQITLFHQPQKPGFWSTIMKAYELGLIKTKTMNTLMRDFYKDYAIAETERVMYTNGFTIVVGKVHEDRITQVNNLQSMELELGMSHGFVQLNKRGNIYEKYRSFEFSVLPLSRAANEWTGVQFSEVIVPLTDQDKSFLDQIENGLADRVETGTAEKSAELQAAGIEFKDNGVVDEPVVTETETVVAEVVVETEVATQEDDKSVATPDPNVIVEQLKAALNLDGLVEAIKAALADAETKTATKLAAIEKRLSEVEQTEDDKVASMYAPNNWARAIAAKTAPEPEKATEGNPKKEALKGWDVPPSQLFWGNTFNK